MTQQTVSFSLLTLILFNFSQSFFVLSAKLLYNGTVDVETGTLVLTKSGPVSGLITVRKGINVSCYLGVPYAEPPLGERRFAEPIAAKPWKSMYRVVFAILKSSLSIFPCQQLANVFHATAAQSNCSRSACACTLPQRES